MNNARKQITAVIDTNLYVSGMILKRGRPFGLLEAWRRGAFLLLLPDDQHGEILDVFSRPEIRERYRLSDEELSEFFSLLETRTRRAPLLPDLPIAVRDTKDEAILAAALLGADYLVTGDNDLLVLAGDPRLGALQIVTARAFLDILQNAE